MCGTSEQTCGGNGKASCARHCSQPPHVQPRHFRGHAYMRAAALDRLRRILPASSVMVAALFVPSEARICVESQTSPFEPQPSSGRPRRRLASIVARPRDEAALLRARDRGSASLSFSGRNPAFARRGSRSTRGASPRTRRGGAGRHLLGRRRRRRGYPLRADTRTPSSVRARRQSSSRS